MISKRKEILKPISGVKWADEMVLNPAIIADGDKIHMLFRATGAYEEKRIEGKPAPYPIFLGYGVSTDGGETFEFDTARPALAPKLAYEFDKIVVKNINGELVTNHANGCIEDPRFFRLDDKVYITCACRMFPPGPYWEHDEPTQCAPEWHNTQQNPYGIAASENVTVNVLFQVDLEKLAAGNYDEAFVYVTHLTDPAYGEDRDVFFFPERINSKIVMLSRPIHPNKFKGITQKKPSILISYSDSFFDFTSGKAVYEVLAEPVFDWEEDKIGASTPPLKLESGEWLLNYHGKKDDELGYTQSFMILEEQNGRVVVKNRCSERLIYAQEEFELPNKFKTPCVFATGLIEYNGDFIMSYGAADENVGILHINKEKLLKKIRGYGA